MEIQGEYLNRQSRKDLLTFTEYTQPGYVIGEHHKLICGALEAVERGDMRRLMIFMPPRHGKSELASKKFPAWYLGRNPSRQIIGASYNSDLATDFGREVRNIVNSPEYQQIFQTRLAQDSTAANRWNTSKKGAYVAAGVGTAITGRGAHLGIIDDPFKDREEADSENRREAVWKWYQSTFRTRLMPGGAILLIQTRWHDDDLAGRILNSGGADEWEVLSLPAINDSGEALWPEWWPVSELEGLRRDIGEREWSALYQQKPQPDEGVFFKREWFQRYDTLPTGVRYYGTSDYAVTEGKGDFTELSVWATDAQTGLYLVDNWSGQTAADTWIERELDLIEKYQPLIWAGEAGPIRKSVEPFQARRERERGVFCRREWVPSVKDKPTRARSFQALAAAGRVHLPNTEAGERALDQLLRFPAGVYDDFVDTASLMGQLLSDVIPGMLAKDGTDKPKRDRYSRESDSGSWKTV